MMQNYYIELQGCDDSTCFTFPVNDEEVDFLKRLAEKSQEYSTYGCQPVMFVKPAEECDQYKLSGLAYGEEIRTEHIRIKKLLEF